MCSSAKLIPRVQEAPTSRVPALLSWQFLHEIPGEPSEWNAYEHSKRSEGRRYSDPCCRMRLNLSPHRRCGQPALTRPSRCGRKHVGYTPLNIDRERDHRMKTAKLFRNGPSQAVRLPREFRFEGDHVFIKRVGNGVLLLPAKACWDSLLYSQAEFSDDFMTGRDQPAQRSRSKLFP